MGESEREIGKGMDRGRKRAPLLVDQEEREIYIEKDR